LFKGFFGGVVYTIEPYELSPYPTGGDVQDFYLVGNSTLAYLYLILWEDLLGGFGYFPSDADMSFLTGLRGDIACLIIPHTP